MCINFDAQIKCGQKCELNGLKPHSQMTTALDQTFELPILNTCAKSIMHIGFQIAFYDLLLYIWEPDMVLQRTCHFTVITLLLFQARIAFPVISDTFTHFWWGEGRRGVCLKRTNAIIGTASGSPYDLLDCSAGTWWKALWKVTAHFTGTTLLWRPAEDNTGLEQILLELNLGWIWFCYSGNLAADWEVFSCLNTSTVLSSNMYCSSP